MKGIIAFILSFILALSLVGCSNDVSQEEYERVLDELNQLQENDTSENSAEMHDDNAGISQSDQNTESTQESQKSESETQSYISWYDEFIAYTSQLDYPRTAGVTDDGIAYWIDRDGVNRKVLVYLYNLNTGNVSTITGRSSYDSDVPFNEWSVVYYKDSIYLIKDTFGSIERYDMNGNLAGTYNISDLAGPINSIDVLSDGSIFITNSSRSVGMPTYLVLSHDFSSVTELPKVVVDVGHGKTEEYNWYYIGEYAGKLYVEVADVMGRTMYTIDLYTGEQAQLDTSYGTFAYSILYDGSGIWYGKYVHVDDKLINLETSEANSMRSSISWELQFTGTNFFSRGGKTGEFTDLFFSRFVPVYDDDKIYLSSEVVLEVPNIADFIVLNDEMVVVTDRTGKYLYRIVEGNTSGELITEIIEG